MKKNYLFLALLVLISIFLFGIVYSYWDYQNASLINPHSQQKNALWARHQWVGNKHTPEEFKKFALLLKENKITDVFFHVGPLNQAGKIELEKYAFANDLIFNLNKDYPNLHLQAWIGQVEKKGGGILDLNKTEVRKNIVNTAKSFLDLGFDGVNYNIEPIYSNDKNFLDLLINTRKITAAKNKILSVSSDELEPFWGAEKIARIFSKQAGFWNKEYYCQVASYVDQIAVMMYDTALPTNWMYAKIVSWETKHLVDIVNPKTTLFMGVPTYDDKRWSFHSEAENMNSGLRGIKKGLISFPQDRIKNFGVAIYAEWTTNSSEWETYKKLWINNL